jgi:hypothetical protein
MGQKAIIMQNVGFLYPGIYIISNSLQPGDLAVSAERQESTKALHQLATRESTVQAWENAMM